MTKKFLLSITVLISAITWSDGKTASAIPVTRLDSIIYIYVQNRDTIAKEMPEQLVPYEYALDIIAKGVLDLGDRIEHKGLKNAIVSRYCHPAFNKLYADVEERFAFGLSKKIMKELQYAFDKLHRLRPDLEMPKDIFTHVSGFNQRVIVAPSFVSVSLDFYLGQDYPLYQEFFTPWQQRHSVADRIAMDALLGWIISEIPEPRDRAITLNDKFHYWSEIYHLMHRIFPKRSEADLFGYSNDEMRWMKANKKHLINNIREREELNSTSPMIIDKYFKEIPEGVALPSNAPREIGPWLAYVMYK